MWAFESVFYQIYPLGFCGASFENTGEEGHGILKVIDWIPHIQGLGCDAVYFSPVFESDTHGYNTRDYRRIDRRLGSNEEFRQVCNSLHDAGIRVVLDGVFNHVGRGYQKFQDVLMNREASPYVNWFHIDFSGNSPYGDGLWYEGWEGNYDLVKLNLKNPAVVTELLDCVGQWISEFEIDGIRLDVAYCLDEDFMRSLRHYTDEKKADFFLLGEMVHGDYNRLTKEGMLHSVTNYECYKGNYSALNSYNMFEIVHSLNRQYGPEGWTLYKGKHLVNFVDNHDVSRIASVIQNPAHLPLAYAMCFLMPGIPMIYYGSEWGCKGLKSQGDQNLRPYFAHYEDNALSEFIGRLARIKREEPALNYGGFRSMVLTNHQCVFARDYEGETVYAAVNASEHSFCASFHPGVETLTNLLTGERLLMAGGLVMEPYSVYILK